MEAFMKLNTNMLEGVLITLSVEETLRILLISIILSTTLFITYRLSHTSLSYNRKFNITLVMIAFITTVLMVLIQTNITLSLGMLGALSIVRFRTNIKDTRDVGFIFWALAIGITSATGNYLIGSISSFLLSIFMIVTSTTLKGREALLLVVRGEHTDINLIEEVVSKSRGTYKVKAKNVLIDSFELVYEIRVSKDEDNKILEKLLSLKGIDSVNILAPNTEVV